MPAERRQSKDEDCPHKQWRGGLGRLEGCKGSREKILNALAPDEALTVQRASENRSSKLDPPTVRTTLDNWACVAAPPLNSFCASAS